jgi:alpha-methylacyl-CoA racemase
LGEVHASLVAWWRGRSHPGHTRHLGGGDVAPVLSMTEAQRDPHLAARGTFVERDGVVQPAPAPRFSRSPTSIGRRPPSPGEHTDEVLRDWTTRADR